MKNSPVVLQVKEVLTLAQYAASKYPIIESSHFGMDHYMNRELKRWEKYSDSATIFIVETDSIFNYDLDFKAYIKYTIAEGLTFFKQINFGSSCLSNAGFMKVTSGLFLSAEDKAHAQRISEEIVAMGGECPFKTLLAPEIYIHTAVAYANCPANRSIFAHSPHVLTTEV